MGAVSYKKNFIFLLEKNHFLIRNFVVTAGETIRLPKDFVFFPLGLVFLSFAISFSFNSVRTQEFFFYIIIIEVLRYVKKIAKKGSQNSRTLINKRFFLYLCPAKIVRN